MSGLLSAAQKRSRCSPCARALISSPQKTRPSLPLSLPLSLSIFHFSRFLPLSLHRFFPSLPLSLSLSLPPSLWKAPTGYGESCPSTLGIIRFIRLPSNI